MEIMKLTAYQGTHKKYLRGILLLLRTRFKIIHNINVTTQSVVINVDFLSLCVHSKN